MEELLEFIDDIFISMDGSVCKEYTITMEDLKTLEELTKRAIKNKEN